MKSIRDEKCRNELAERIRNLSPDAKASWGRMNVEQMLSHLVQANELTFVATVPDLSMTACFCSTGAGVAVETLMARPDGPPSEIPREHGLFA